MTHHITIQCTAPTGQTGCFLYQAPTNDLNFRFIGPRDIRKLGSPVFGHVGALYDWIEAQGLKVDHWSHRPASTVELN